MTTESGKYGDVRQALDRLADLLLFPERFSQDPRTALQEQGLGDAIPDEVVNALSRMSGDELRVLAQARRKQEGLLPDDLEVGIFF
jgi:hypothetical protein